ncbi:iron chelate uptake ABC transporter family permease subunit, partial [Morganella morganii]
MPTSRTFTLLLQHQRYRDKRQIGLLALCVAVALLFSLCAGDQWIWPSEWFSDRAQLFVWQLRLPRALAVMLVGAALAVAGAVMQALFENPLAEPGLLGVANGAGVALVLTVLLGQGLLPVALMSAAAIAGALAMTFLLLGFARRRRLTNARLLLVGVALGIVCSELMTW